MDFRFSPEELAFRDEVEAFLSKELPPNWTEQSEYWPGGYGSAPNFHERDAFAIHFLQRMAEEGYLFMAWPKEYGGGGRSFMEQAIFGERCTYHLAPGPDPSILILGPMIIQVGSEEMKREWIPKLMKANQVWWIGYSEPDSGSDLSSMKTTAIEDGDHFVINGQKIWSSGAHLADFGWILARTDPNTSPYNGLSLIIVDNKMPGITIRPIINIVGYHSFNEVFFDNVRVPKKNLIGERNKGWFYMMVALDFERLVHSIGGFRRQHEDLVKYAKETKRGGKYIAAYPETKQKLADLAIEIEVAYMFFYKTAWMLDKGLFPNVESSVLKLVATLLSKKLADAAMEIIGPFGQLVKGSKYAQLNGRASLGYLDSISGLIGAGTTEIQRSIIAQRGLGLPRK